MKTTFGNLRLIGGIAALNFFGGCLGICQVPASKVTKTMPQNTASLVEAQASEAPAPIQFHGGPVMLGTTHLYYIWYGDWSPSDKTVQVLTDFGNSLGSSPYFSINTTYTNLFGMPVANSLTFGGSMYDRYSLGHRLRESDVLNVVMAKQPFDPWGLYLVIGAPDVDQVNDDDENACGWHDHSFQFLFFRDIKFGFIGNPEQLPACIAQSTVSPNDDPTADAMASMIAHEISEAVTDPDANAWYDANGEEVADKCKWNFGPEPYYTPNGALANVHLGSRDFFIQELWVNAKTGYCALNLGDPAHGDTINDTEALYPGQSIQSRSGRYSLVLQGDGNLVLYESGGKALWSSHTAGQPTVFANVQDGNLVIYAGGLKPIWASHTSKNPRSHLTMQDDGNAVIYRPDHSVVWATNTVQQ